MQRTTAAAVSLMLLSIVACAQVDVNKLHVPPGFHIAIFADTQSQPRLMTWSPGGVLMAASADEGTVIAMPDPQHTNRAQRVLTVLKDLNGPNSLQFHNGKLYVAEVTRVVRYDWDEANLRASNPQKIADLPSSGGGHMTRTILFANGKMYVSVGSSCNVCVEKDPRRAAVLEFNDDGSGQRIFASGLRNAVGLAFDPRTGTVWASDNGRDWLGDNLPPDEVNNLGKNGGDFGFPYCYGNRVPDLKFSSDAASKCAKTIPPVVDLPAHSAPLGIAFNEGSMFPADYRGNLFVAYHGSWNRSIPTGYKVVRIKLDSNSKPEGIEDFATGWLPPGATLITRKMGRPVGVLFGSDGSLYISDDRSGAIYRVTYGR
jgi:glucose/arabinose dehydrogenase